MDLAKLTTGEWVIVFATVMGPVLAVQAQKFLEGLREYRGHKLWVFRSLMTTRMQRLSFDHVKALNMIDISFYGKRIFVWHWQTKAEKKVCMAWKIYLDNLAESTDDWHESRLTVHYTDRERQFNTMLAAIAEAVDYNFDEVHLKKTGYIPVAHSDLEEKHKELLESAVGVLQGTKSLKMDVISLPNNPEVAANYQKVIAQMVGATEGGAFRVKSSVQAD